MTQTKGAILRAIGSAGIAAVVGLLTATVLRTPLPWAAAMGVVTAGAFSLFYSSLSRRNQGYGARLHSFNYDPARIDFRHYPAMERFPNRPDILRMWDSAEPVEKAKLKCDY